MARRWHDDANWTDIEFNSIMIKNGRYPYNGYPHVTVGEQMLARLLTRQGIPYTPDVRMTFRDESGKWGVTFVPDFVFNRYSFVWCSEKGRQFLIHGIEVKRASRGFFPGKTIRKARLLRNEKNINILLLSHKQIRQYTMRGGLPLHKPRFRKKETKEKLQAEKRRATRRMKSRC